MTKRKLHMTKNKLKKVAMLLFICIIAILIWNGFRISQKISDGMEKKNRDNEEISTSMPVDLSTKITESFISDYTNPTFEEEAKAYERYGYDNCYFTSNGLIVKADEYNNIPERLFTNVWQESEASNKILKPSIGEISLIELPDDSSYVFITLKSVEKKEVQDYVKEVKKEYSKEKKKKNLETYIYYGTNESGDEVRITYDESNAVAFIKYYFLVNSI